MEILVKNSNSKSIVFSDMSGHNKSTYCAAIGILVRVSTRLSSYLQKWKFLLHQFQERHSELHRLLSPTMENDSAEALEAGTPSDATVVEVNEDGTGGDVSVTPTTPNRDCFWHSIIRSDSVSS